uniref:UMOD/GP2/OIT3-like D8C domain-containing protein n=1 Tax=Magallana gigas TaxID=29159 RepID=A0A8W8J431_MAGGI
MIWVLTLSFCLTCCVLGDIDPCLDGNFELLDSPGLRGGACKMQAGNVICDRSIRNGWYKVIHEDDFEHRQMMEGIVSPNYCGTSNPIWLNGTHPVAADGIVNRTACVVGIHGYCSKEYDIQIKACGENEYVYYLIKAESCNEGYCFGVNLPCAKPNPCEEGNSIKMDVKEDRSTSCKEKSMSMCDNSLKHGWYRIQRNGVDMKMPTTCVDQYSCGTVSPIWLSENEQTTKLWEYILAAVAGIIVLFIIVSIVSYILFKKTLRLKKIQCDKKFQEPKKQSQLEIQ